MKDLFIYFLALKLQLWGIWFRFRMISLLYQVIVLFPVGALHFLITVSKACIWLGFLKCTASLDI